MGNDRPTVSIATNEMLAETTCDLTRTPALAYVVSKDGQLSQQENITIDARRFVPPTASLGMIEAGVVMLPSMAEDYGTQAELVTEIIGFIHRYADMPPFWEELIAHYILMTWVYDRFTAVPYLRFMGEPGTGKSRSLHVAGVLAYKGTFAGGATTTSPMFRLVDVFRGTLAIDEGDYRNSDAWSDVVKILNSGYMKGSPVLRSEKIGDSYEPRAYDVYGPKIIANRYPFSDHALETRCITLQMEEHSLRTDVPRQLPAEKFYEEAQRLRNKLLKWRFDHFAKIKPDESKLLHLEPRLTQIGTPLFSVSTDESFRERLIEFLSDYGQEQRSERPQGGVVQAIVNLAVGPSTLSVKKITDEANRVLESDEELTSKKVGSMLRSLGFKPRRTKHGYEVQVSAKQLESLKSSLTG